MKLPDTEQFNFKACEVAGDACWLITPREIGCKWTDDVARFRSVIITQKDHVVVSQGFGKFTNYGERPDFQTWDDAWPIKARHKLDGSLLIVSRYKGQWILRTRGTVDARQLANGHEIDLLMKKYESFFGEYADKLAIEPDGSHRASYLFEWTTPNNIIVLREHDEPTLTLLGVVMHNDYYDSDKEGVLYYTQSNVDKWLDRNKFNFERPKTYTYESLAECMSDVLAWQGKEGVVIYSPDGQIMKKIKSDAYCELHKISTGLVTIKNVVELFMATPRFTKYSDFYHYVETTKDFEVAEKIKDHMLTVVVAYCKALDKIEKVKNVVTQVRNGFDRKEQAQQFQLHYNGTDWRLPLAFQLLDNRPISDKLIERAIFDEIV